MLCGNPNHIPFGEIALGWKVRQSTERGAPWWWQSVILICAVATARAQYRFDSWTMADGLPQNSVTALVQTRDGYLWFTTIDGLVRFDGLRFTVFDRSNTPAITSNRFLSLHEDAEGTLWAGTEYGGLGRYRDGEFSAFTTAQGLPSNDIEEIRGEIRGTATGGVFIRTPGGYGLVREGKFTPAVDPLIALQEKTFIAPNGTRWRVASDEVLKAVKSTERERAVRLLFRNPAYFVALNAQGKLLFEDRQGALWGSTHSTQMFRVKDGSLSFFGTPAAAPSPPARAVANLPHHRCRRPRRYAVVWHESWFALFSGTPLCALHHWRWLG